MFSNISPIKYNNNNNSNNSNIILEDDCVSTYDLFDIDFDESIVKESSNEESSNEESSNEEFDWHGHPACKDLDSGQYPTVPINDEDSGINQYEEPNYENFVWECHSDVWDDADLAQFPTVSINDEESGLNQYVPTTIRRSHTFNQSLYPLPTVCYVDDQSLDEIQNKWVMCNAVIQQSDYYYFKPDPKLKHQQKKTILPKLELVLSNEEIMHKFINRCLCRFKARHFIRDYNTKTSDHTFWIKLILHSFENSKDGDYFRVDHGCNISYSIIKTWVNIVLFELSCKHLRNRYAGNSK